MQIRKIDTRVTKSVSLSVTDAVTFGTVRPPMTSGSEEFRED
jgi:hypothetical protein